MSSKNYYRKLRSQATIATVIPSPPSRQEGVDLSKWEDDPDGFITHVLGVEFLTDEQRKILKDISEKSTTNIQASHGIGKTFLMACLVLWATFSRHAYCITSAPTDRQVRHLLWKEIRRLYDANKTKLGGRRGVLFVEKSETAYAFGFASYDHKSDTFQGVHSFRLIIILDEASGISHAIDEGASSCITGSENKMIRIGNPLDSVSAFGQACKISNIKITSWSHPNVNWFYELVPAPPSLRERYPEGIHRPKREYVAKVFKPEIVPQILEALDKRVEWPLGLTDDPILPQHEWSQDLPRDVVPGAVSVQWVEKTRIKYGEGSVYWESRVEANFPTETAEGIVPYTFLLKARARYDSNPRQWDILALSYGWVLGVDVGDKSDRHSIALWRGPVLYQVRILDVLGDDEDTARLVDEIEKIVHRLGGKGVVRVAIDRIGVGAHVVADLKRRGYAIYPCIFGSDAHDKSQFTNRKAELYWKFRDGLRLETFAIAPLGDSEEMVFEELKAIRYNTNSEKKIACEPKEKTRARLKRSPDGADGVVTGLECEWQTIDVPAIVVKEEREALPSWDDSSVSDVAQWFKS